MCGLCMRMIRCESESPGVGEEGDGKEKGVCGSEKGRDFGGSLHDVLMQGRACICLAEIWPILRSLTVISSSEAFWVPCCLCTVVLL